MQAFQLGIDNGVMFFHFPPLSALDLVRFWGRVSVATGFECSPHVLFFLFLPPCLCGPSLSSWSKVLMTFSLCSSGRCEWKSKYSSVFRFSVHLNVEASIFFAVYCTVQEGQTVSSDIFPHELDVIVHSNYLFCKGFHLLDFNRDIVNIPESVARSSFYEVNWGSALHFFHVEVCHH